jgi:hypothetical protein
MGRDGARCGSSGAVITEGMIPMSGGGSQSLAFDQGENGPGAKTVSSSCRTHDDGLCCSARGQQQTRTRQQISFDAPSTKVLRKEYATGLRWIAWYLAKNSPTQTLIEAGRLEIKRVNNPSTAATTTCLLRHCHHTRSDPGAAECLQATLVRLTVGGRPRHTPK